jgi:ABC-type antimicrobial peptide transport system permease subunit
MSETCLATLGVRPARGRAFVAEEFEPGKGHVVLLTDGFWRRRYGAAPDAVGRILKVDDLPYTVVGVLPPTFKTLGELEAADEASVDRSVAIVVPFAGGPTFWRDNTSSDQAGRGLRIIGRLRQGVPLARARVEVSTVIARTHNLGTVTRVNQTLVPVTAHVLGTLPSQMTLLAVAVGVLLLVACINVSNLLLVRAEARQGEAAIRASMGASTGTLVRSSCYEVLALGVAGGCVGALLAWGAFVWCRRPPTDC